MKIAIVNETSSADKNAHILSALQDIGHVVLNCGMTEKGGDPELQYIHTGLMAALLLESGRADFVVGSCGTGQGFLNAVMQYPGVCCGHILSPLDAWLFTQINGGNCISLALNQGYGWASDVNLRFIFDRLFGVEPGAGYPPERKEPQARSRTALSEISGLVHHSFPEIIGRLPDYVLHPVLRYPGFLELIDIPGLHDDAFGEALSQRARNENPTPAE